MIYPYKESKRLVMKNFFNSISCLIFAKFSGRRRQVCVACHCFINFLSLGYRPLSDRIKSNFRHYYQRCPSFQHQPPRAGKHCSHCDSHGGIIGIRLCVGKRDGIFLSHLERHRQCGKRRKARSTEPPATEARATTCHHSHRQQLCQRDHRVAPQLCLDSDYGVSQCGIRFRVSIRHSHLYVAVVWRDTPQAL